MGSKAYWGVFWEAGLLRSYSQLVAVLHCSATRLPGPPAMVTAEGRILAPPMRTTSTQTRIVCRRSRIRRHQSTTLRGHTPFSEIQHRCITPFVLWFWALIKGAVGMERSAASRIGI